MTLDISKYDHLPHGMINLNARVYRAIKEKTGFEAKSCSIEKIILYKNKTLVHA